METVHTILFDFDGTLLPCCPYDSEQALLDRLVRTAKKRFRWFERIEARAAIFVDRQELSAGFFKKTYTKHVTGTRRNTLTTLCTDLARTVSAENRAAVRELKAAGFSMSVISCGTADLADGVLQSCGIRSCFDTVEGNRFRMKNGVVSGVDMHMATPLQKVRMAESMGANPAETIAVGDGYTDLPLLDWVRYPVMIDRNGAKAHRYRKNGYLFISDIHELPGLLYRLFRIKTGRKTRTGPKRSSCQKKS